MDWLYKIELDNKIKELASRRRTLEKQLEIRSATMLELQTLRQVSLQRVYQAVEEQNIQALARNKAIREELHCSVGQSIPYKKEQRLSNSSANLKEAKRQYYRHIEAKLPVLHRCQTIQMEERVRAIQLEKEMSARRQEQLRLELARENEVKHKLEHHRQDLMNSLAVEQKILLESKANSILLEEERKSADARILQNITQATQLTKHRLYDNVLRMQYESQELQNQASVTSNYHQNFHHPESETQRMTTKGTTEPLYARHTLATTDTREVVDSTMPHEAEEYQYKQQQPNRQGTLVLSEVEKVGVQTPGTSYTAAAAGNHVATSSSTTEECIHISAQENIMSPSIASAYTPRSRGISTSTHTPKDSKPTSPGKYSSSDYNHNNTSSISPTSRLFGGIKETEVEEEEKEDVILTLPSSYRHSSSGYNSHSSSPVGKNQVFMQNQGNIESNSNKSHTAAAATTTTTSATAKYTDQAQSGNLSWGENNTYSNSPLQSPTPSAPHSPTTATATTPPHQSITEQQEKEVSMHSNSHSFSFDTESMKKHTFGGSESSRLHSNQSENSSKQTGLDMNMLINNLSITQSTILLQLLASTIEERLVAHSISIHSTTNITAIYNSQTRHRAAHIIDAYHHSTSTEDSHLTAILHNAADSTLGNAVLAIAEGKSDSLIPRDAFTGVVTMEKLRKEYKRTGPSGIVQLWEALTAHLQRLVAHNANLLDFLATCFTTALTVHVEEEEDRTRLERKVSHLLQLALIPPENKDQRSPSPPYRTRGQLSSPPGQYPRSNPLDPNMSSISYSTAPDSTPVKPSGAQLPTAPAATAVISTTSQQGIWPSPANKHTLNNTNSNSTSSPRGGSGTATGRNPALATMYAKASVALRSHRTAAATEFDDDEIADDESIEAPPALRDLDITTTTTKKTTTSFDHSDATGSSDEDQRGEDEFDF